MKLTRIYKLTGRLTCIVLLLSFSFSACKKDFGDINKSWDNKVYQAEITGLYNGIVASIVELHPKGLVLASWVYQNSQLATMYAATGFRMDNLVGEAWANYYTALANSIKLQELVDADPNAANMTNVVAMTKTLIAYKTLQSTFMFGDMPYTEAGRAFTGGAEFYRPKYDAQEEIIKTALEDLKWASDNFSDNADQVSLGASETLLHGDIAKWRKLANSLRMRYAISIHQKDATTANAILAEVITKPLLAPDEVIGLYPSAIPNFVYDRGGWYRGNSYVRMGSTMWDAMSSSDDTDGSGIYDLRGKIFFEPNSDNEWAPFPQVPNSGTPAEVGNSGNNDPYAESRLSTWVTGGTWHYSPLNGYYVSDKTLPQLLITGEEVSFIKAEMYNRGIGGVAADQALAKSNYEAGVTASVNFWYQLANSTATWTVNKPPATPPADDLTAMLENPGVAYGADAATGLSMIYKQHWIALFHQPYEGWNLARRTNYATPGVELPSSSAGYQVYRLIYPPSEMDSNNDNWRLATGGSDLSSKKPWFMP